MKQNITLYRNTTYTMTYTHTEAMTGGTVYFTVKSATYDTDADDSAATITKNVTSFSINDTRATWVLSAADTYKDPGTYNYDISYKDSTGVVLPPAFYGKCKITPHPTNRSAA